jgi:hypothetical protein
MKKNDNIDHKEIPSYYIGKNYGIRGSDVIDDFDLSYNVGTAVTYLLRAGDKVYVNDSKEESKIADILKAINHLKFELKKLGYEHKEQ